MMTFENIYEKAASDEAAKAFDAAAGKPTAKPTGEPVFILHESGLGSRVLGQGSTYNKMFADAAMKLGLPEAEVRAAGYKFSVEHKEILKEDRNKVELFSDGRSIQPIIDSALHPMADSPDPQSDPESAAAFELLEKRRAQMARAREARMAKIAARKAAVP